MRTYGNPKLVTAERAGEIIRAGGRVHRDDRYTGDYRYIVDDMGRLGCGDDPGATDDRPCYEPSNPQCSARDAQVCAGPAGHPVGSDHTNGTWPAHAAPKPTCGQCGARHEDDQPGGGDRG